MNSAFSTSVPSKSDAIPAQVDAYTNFDVAMTEAVSVIDCIYQQHAKGTVLPMRKRRTA